MNVWSNPPTNTPMPSAISSVQGDPAAEARRINRLLATNGSLAFGELNLDRFIEAREVDQPYHTRRVFRAHRPIQPHAVHQGVAFANPERERHAVSSLGNVSERFQRFAIDFRTVYAGILDNWMGADHDAILGRGFRPAKVIEI